MEPSNQKTLSWALTNRASLHDMALAAEFVMLAHDSKSSFELQSAMEYLSSAYARAKETLEKSLENENTNH
jgi:hypothetical protein